MSTTTSIRCFLCQLETLETTIPFSCDHNLCIQCLYRTISINEIKELENLDSISFHCPCNAGSSFIPIEHCLMLFKQHYLNSKLAFPKKTVPKIQRKNSWIFTTQGDGDNYIQIIETKFRDKWLSELNLRSQQFDELNTLLVQMQKEYIDKMNQQFNKAISLFTILKIVYSNFFNDGSLESKALKSKSELLDSIGQKNKLDLKEIKFNINHNNQNNDFDVIKDKINSFYYHIKLAFDFNFKNKEIGSSNVLNGHNDSIFSLSKLGEFKIASGSNDKSIKVWDLNKMICTKVLNGHAGSVLSLKYLQDTRLASGSGDKTIKIWDGTEMALKHTLIGHDSEIYAGEQLKNGKLVSGSGDKTIKIWDLNTLECERTLTGHSRSVYSGIAGEDSRLCSGSVDWKIGIWDGENVYDNNVVVLTGHTGAVNCLLQGKDKKVASGSTDFTIKIWNVSTLTCEVTITGSKTSILSMIQGADERIIAGTNQVIYFYDIYQKIITQTIQGHNKNVNAIIECSNDIIVSGSSDNNIGIWDLSG